MQIKFRGRGDAHTVGGVSRWVWSAGLCTGWVFSGGAPPVGPFKQDRTSLRRGRHRYRHHHTGEISVSHPKWRIGGQIDLRLTDGLIVEIEAWIEVSVFSRCTFA
jgi:hypothetical protein